MCIVHRMSHTHIGGLRQHSSYVILSQSELCVDQECTLQICSTYENSSANKLHLKHKVYSDTLPLCTILLEALHSRKDCYIVCT